MLVAEGRTWREEGVENMNPRENDPGKKGRGFSLMLLLFLLIFYLSIVVTQCYIGFRCITYWFNFSVCYTHLRSSHHLHHTTLAVPDLLQGGSTVSRDSSSDRVGSSSWNQQGALREGFVISAPELCVYTTCKHQLSTKWSDNHMNKGKETRANLQCNAIN